MCIRDRDMTDHEAVEAMKDSNKQRDQTLPSELAALLDLEVEDIKHQGSRLKNVAEGDIGTVSYTHLDGAMQKIPSNGMKGHTHNFTSMP